MLNLQTETPRGSSNPLFTEIKYSNADYLAHGLDDRMNEAVAVAAVTHTGRVLPPVDGGSHVRCSALCRCIMWNFLRMCE
jgi:hypothetical protein